MASLKILVLENQSFPRTILVKMLQRLGVRNVLQASTTEHALVEMYLQGGVDIVVCDLADRELDCLEFLRCASHRDMIRAVALCSELPPELRRTLGQMKQLSGLPLLRVISHPVQMCSLQGMLRDYNACLIDAVSFPLHSELPSEDEIRLGLALGEFRAWFQPQFDLRSGAVVGVEALVRWEHPARGVLLPGDFLAAVLAYNLINQMFKQLLEQGLGLLEILRTQGISMVLALNLHASQLASSNLIEHIKLALERHSFRGTTLTFEVAENGLLNCSSDVQKQLLRLRLLGCSLSVDDFGLGFSSLKLLGQLPFNQIKLDARFVQRLDCPSNRAMVVSSLALASSLGMSLVIEGVSSVDIRDGLLELGCETGQGFYLAKPMNGRDLLKMLHRRQIEY